MIPIFIGVYASAIKLPEVRAIMDTVIFRFGGYAQPSLADQYTETNRTSPHKPAEYYADGSFEYNNIRFIDDEMVTSGYVYTKTEFVDPDGVLPTEVAAIEHRLVTILKRDGSFSHKNLTYTYRGTLHPQADDKFDLGAYFDGGYTSTTTNQDSILITNGFFSSNLPTSYKVDGVYPPTVNNSFSMLHFTVFRKLGAPNAKTITLLQNPYTSVYTNYLAIDGTTYSTTAGSSYNRGVSLSFSTSEFGTTLLNNGNILVTVDGINYFPNRYFELLPGTYGTDYDSDGIGNTTAVKAQSAGVFEINPTTKTIRELFSYRDAQGVKTPAFSSVVRGSYSYDPLANVADYSAMSYPYRLVAGTNSMYVSSNNSHMYFVPYTVEITAPNNTSDTPNIGQDTIAVCKIDYATGNLLWAKSLSGPDPADNGYTDLSYTLTYVDDNGDLVLPIDGRISGQSDTIIGLAKISSAGNLIWYTAIGDIFPAYNNPRETGDYDTTIAEFNVFEQQFITVNKDDNKLLLTSSYSGVNNHPSVDGYTGNQIAVELDYSTGIPTALVRDIEFAANVIEENNTSSDFYGMVRSIDYDPRTPIVYNPNGEDYISVREVEYYATDDYYAGGKIGYYPSNLYTYAQAFEVKMAKKDSTTFQLTDDKTIRVTYREELSGSNHQGKPFKNSFGLLNYDHWNANDPLIPISLTTTDIRISNSGPNGIITALELYDNFAIPIVTDYSNPKFRTSVIGYPDITPSFLKFDKMEASYVSADLVSEAIVESISCATFYETQEANAQSLDLVSAFIDDAAGVQSIGLTTAFENNDAGAQSLLLMHVVDDTDLGASNVVNLHVSQDTAFSLVADPTYASIQDTDMSVVQSPLNTVVNDNDERIANAPIYYVTTILS